MKTYNSKSIEDYLKAIFKLGENEVKTQEAEKTEEAKEEAMVDTSVTESKEAEAKSESTEVEVKAEEIKAETPAAASETETEVDTEAKTELEAVTSKASAESVADDLTRIEGIGPKISAALIAQGIDTFKKLESSDVKTLKSALANEGIKFAPSADTWAKQAEYLVNGDEEGFKEYTDYLVAGRNPDS